MLSDFRTLDSRTNTTGFETEHLRILRALETVELPDDLSLGQLRDQCDPQVCDVAVRTWRERMVNEHRSSSVFAGLLPQLIEASCSVDIQTVVLRAATDEIHHAVLCGKVITAFGGEPVAQAEPQLVPVPTHGDVPPLERVLRNLLFVGCLAETVAVSLITEERELCDQPFIHAVFTRILADEVNHARMGWRFVSTLLPTVDESTRARTNEYLRVAFGYLEKREIPLLPLTPPMSRALIDQAALAGLCVGQHARDVFYACINDVIVPGLQTLGLDARNAWESRVV